MHVTCPWKQEMEEDARTCVLQAQGCPLGYDCPLSENFGRIVYLNTEKPDAAVAKAHS